MVQLKATCLCKSSFMLGILVLSVCALTGTRASAQGDDLINAASKGDLSL